MSVNSRTKATKILAQREASYRQRIPGFSCARKETVDIDILVTSTNGHKKIMQSITIMSRASSVLEPVLKNIYQSNTYRKDLSRPHFNDELRVQEKQHMKDQQSCTSPDVTTVFHTWTYGSFIEIQSNLRRKQLHRTN